jgi:predicted kinase
MLSPDPTLHMVCGKPAAGKSTLTRQLAAAPLTVLISEDEWLSELYKDELTTVADHFRRSLRLRKALRGHIEALLRVGLSVVLDFPANTLADRRWMRSLFENAGAAHRLHYLDVPDAVCKARLRQRNAEGAHPFTVTDAEFDTVAHYFVPPTAEEGFDVVVYREP